MNQDRRQRILEAMTVELRRQGQPAGVDLAALATAVEAALGPAEAPGPVDEGVTPENLNSANDG